MLLSGKSPASSRTPIKWPGGKSKEFINVKHLIPHYDRYFEPFFGGGAFFFQLQPEAAVINDFSPDLTDFYRFLKGELDREAFSTELYAYVDNWEKIPDYIDHFNDKLVDVYKKYKNHKINLPSLRHDIEVLIEGNENKFNGLFSEDFCLDQQNLARQIAQNLTSKISRMAIIEERRGQLPDTDLYKNIETAFRSGFYMHFRDVMNGRFKVKKISLAKRTATFYFIREFCYGSMFRYNVLGEFNIPYGGIAYNSKDFRRKVDHILANKFQELFSGVTIETGDFEKALAKHKPTKNDFIFLDPPYDSDFSDYDNQSFDITDHERLARYLYKAEAKWLLLIKATPLINSLYLNKTGISIESFDKRYLYNVKGRNDQKAKHLAVYNYPV